MINVGKTITKAALRDLTDNRLFELVEQIGDLAHIRYVNQDTTFEDAVITEPKRDDDHDIVRDDEGRPVYTTKTIKDKGGLKIKERVDKWVIVI